jgi:hypothetical protein
MRLSLLEEPELEFAAGRHIDIRFGLTDYGPLGRLAESPLHSIRVGIVGTSETLEGVSNWLDGCRTEIQAKASKRPNLFPRFPGFSRETSWDATLEFGATLQRTVSQSDVASLVARQMTAEAIEEAVDLFGTECEHIAEKGLAQVIVCAPPVDLMNAVDAVARDDEEDHERPIVPKWLQRKQIPPPRLPEFHDVLKARTMRLGPPVQMVRPATYDPTKRRKQRARRDKFRALQDDATRAWNFHTALYYKAGGPLWRLASQRTDLSACYVGVSFYRSSDNSVLMTSMAQVFNERGDGVVVRGGQVVPDKTDRQPHLDSDGAESLLRTALGHYRDEHKTLPARIVLHKTSSFTALESEGFKSAAAAEHITSLELIWIGDSDSKLFRPSIYPPLRGTHWEVDSSTSILYTRGSVDFFTAYPGLYVPRPLRLRYEQVEQTPSFLARETLALSKMNWNSTQFDNRDPITIRAARQVGAILKHVPEGGILRARYAYYM